MDLVAGCKVKLSHFRLKELKEVLTILGLSKQGKKQDLVERILSRLSEDQVLKKSSSMKKSAGGIEEVAKLVDDAYRKLQLSMATELASKGPALDGNNAESTGEFDDIVYIDMRVRCPCGNSIETDSMIRCEDPGCNVWQHIDCVLIPQEATEGKLPVHDAFYCELCRLSRADPFWVSIAHPLHPALMVTVDAPADGTNKVQSVEKTFQLTRADKDLLSRQDYDVQAWCMLLNDKVPFRMQWPQYANLQVNGIPVRAVNRPGSQLLGANGRDDGPIITPCTKDGINNISLTGCDARIFCVGVRIVRRQTVQQIFNLIPKESDGEDLEDALARVCRCIGGGGPTEADSDSDIEVVEDSVAINLRCPMSGSRIKIAGRFKPCVHMGCFDLEVFVRLNERSRKWQCPICLKNYSVEDIIIDPYLNRVTSMMRSCEEGITDIEVKQDGSWRLKAKSDGERSKFGELGKWHSPDGTVCVSNEEEVRSMEEGLKQVKQETALGHNHLKPGTKKNCNGLWEGSQPADTNNSSSNEVLMTRYVNMSSSGSGSSWDGEDTSISHQGGCRNLHFSAKNESEHDYVNSACGESAKKFSGTIANAEVIILSDSDEDDQLLISSTYIPIVKQSHSMPPAIADSFEVPIASHTVWPTPSGSQEGPGFQLLDLDDDVYDPIVIVDLQQASTSGPTPTSTNGYNLAPQTTEPASLIPDGSVGHPDSDMDYSLVDNPLANDRDDPSLQIFLPTRPSGTEDSREQQVVSKGFLTGDWISLSLGDGGVKVPCGPTTTENGVIPTQQIPSGGAMDSLTDNDSDIPINVIRSRMTRRSGKVGKETSNSHNPINFMRPDETRRSGVAGGETTDSDTPISLSITSAKASGHTSDCPSPSPTPFLKSRQAILSGRETGETSDSDTPINVLKSRMTTRSRKTGREASNSHNPINFTRSCKTIMDPAVIIPQQKRSVRPRVYVSFDSDSDPEWW